MMQEATVLREDRDHVAVLTINRPARRNAVDLPTIRALGASVRSAIDDPGIAVLMVTGAGAAAFCAGSDMDEMERHTPLSYDLEMEAWTAALALIEASPKPVVAAVNGFALGGGNELALACHLRVAAEHAWFSQPEIGLGHIPGCGGTQRLARLLPRGVALELMLLGEPLQVAEAHRLGLVNRVWPVDGFMAQALAYATKLAAQSSVAMRYILEAVKASEPSIEPGLRLERALCGLVLESAESKAGLAAYFERKRRKPA